MVIHLTGLWMVLIDFTAWLTIHIVVSCAIAHPPAHVFHPESWLYRQRRWEKNGRIYEFLFHVKKWKEILPDGAALFESGFRKKRLQSADEAYLGRFVRETCRAEVTHWAIFFCAPFFFIWNPWHIGIIMIAYASLVNMPCIITQRYNRIRLNRLARNHHLSP